MQLATVCRNKRDIGNIMSFRNYLELLSESICNILAFAQRKLRWENKALICVVQAAYAKPHCCAARIAPCEGVWHRNVTDAGHKSWPHLRRSRSLGKALR